MTQRKTASCLSRAEDGHFEPVHGYRDWLEIPDLGPGDATGGRYDARVTRANEVGGSTGRHYHNHDFQIMYVTRGRFRMYHEGEVEFILKAGDFAYHPPGQVHDFMDYSADSEIFEFASPADHSAIDV